MAQQHFNPSFVFDPQEQKKLHSNLEQIDFAAFDANRQVLARKIGRVDVKAFKKLAASVAVTRANWVSAALVLSDRTTPPSDTDVAHLAALRAAYQELTEAYDAMRRMVERGYLCYLETGG